MARIIVIPARMDSTRFPGKPMAMAAGKPLIEWVYNSAKEVPLVDKVVVATSDHIIWEYCEAAQHDIECVRTLPDFPNGTARVAAAIRMFANPGDQIVNWQGDEVRIDVNSVEKLFQVDGIGTLVWRPGSVMANFPIDENVVKCIICNDVCQWFTRQWLPTCKIHIGIYKYPYDLLQELAVAPPSAAAEAESLEQLTWLEMGYQIIPVLTSRMPRSINTPDDLIQFKRLVEQ